MRRVIHLKDEKKTYYITLVNGEIMTSATDSPWQYKIEATEDEIIKLREIFDSSDDNSVYDFLRAHVPFVEYHQDRTNDQYDQNLLRAYQMIYDLGDEEAKSHISGIGILDNFTTE